MVGEAANLAGGAPQQAAPQQVQVAPGAAPQGGDQQLILQVLEQAITQSVDESGFVDVKALAQLWPQVAQQAGLNIPFETVLQMIQANPEMVQEIIMKHGLAGITVDGRQISGQELSGDTGGV